MTQKTINTKRNAEWHITHRQQKSGNALKQVSMTSLMTGCHGDSPPMGSGIEVTAEQTEETQSDLKWGGQQDLEICGNVIMWKYDNVKMSCESTMYMYDNIEV